MKITLQKDEPMKALDLVQKLTGMDLSAVKAKMAGLTITGDIILTEKISETETFTAEIVLQ